MDYSSLGIKLKDLPSNIDLAIVGSGSLEDDLRAKVEALDLEQRVNFYGEQLHSDMPLWINAADVFCLPSINEGMPNVVLESLACGIPVTATNVGGVGEIINSPKAGILVPAKDAGALREGIVRCLESRWDRNQ